MCDQKLDGTLIEQNILFIKRGKVIKTYKAYIQRKLVLLCQIRQDALPLRASLAMAYKALGPLAPV